MIEDDAEEPASPEDRQKTKDLCKQITSSSLARVESVKLIQAMSKMDGVLTLMEYEFGTEVCEGLKSILLRSMNSDGKFQKVQPKLHYMWQRQSHIFQVTVNSKAAVQVQTKSSTFDSAILTARVLFYLVASGAEKFAVEHVKKAIMA